jgi:hypothetical protein
VSVGPGGSATQGFTLAPQPGTISGTVADAGTGLPIVGATVSDGGGTATTDQTGHYTLGSVAEGTHTITATATGYVLQPATVTVAPGGAAAADFSLSQPGTTLVPNIMVIMMENKEYTTVVGDSINAPYINNTLIPNFELLTNISAVTHNSLANYLADTSGVVSDPALTTHDCTTCGPFNVENIVHEMSVAGVPWRAYMEDMPSVCYSGVTLSGNYAKRHNPFVYYTDIVSSSLCNNVVPFTQFSTDLSGSSPPNFMWVTPNLVHDMHMTSSTSTTALQLAAGDAWLNTQINFIQGTSWYANGGTIIVTWDEGTMNTGFPGSAGGGHIPTILISNHLQGAVPYPASGNAYALERGIEEKYGIGLIEAAADSANGDLRRAF